MSDKIEQLKTKLRSRPGFKEHFVQLYKRSSQVIVFGSYAAGCEDENSDVDILFVSDANSYKDQYLDFVCVKPSRFKLRSWHGSELANHVAKYGVWLKGDDGWRHSVFVSQSAIDRKKIILLTRLSHLWVKHKKIKRASMIALFSEVVLDSYRLIMLSKAEPVPPTALIHRMFQCDNKNILKVLTKPMYLGRLGEAFINELFRKTDSRAIIVQLKRRSTATRK